MYLVRVKPSPTLSLEGLTPLVTHEGKNVPSDKELRVSGGWKVKEVPGTGSSFGRGPHRKAAVDGLEALWTKALNDRKCSQGDGGIWSATVPKGASYVTVGNLRSLLAVTDLIDQLSDQHGISESVATSLVAYAVMRVGIGQIATQSARLDAAAVQLAAAPSMSVVAAYNQTGQARGAHWAIQTLPGAVGEASKTVVLPVATSQHLQPLLPQTQVSKPQAPQLQVTQPQASPPQSDAGPGLNKPGVRLESKGRQFTDEGHADKHLRSILAGGAPNAVAAVVSGTEKPLLIAKLVRALDELGAQSADTPEYKTKLLRVARFFDMWQLQRPTPERPAFTAEDRAALPEWMAHAMSKRTELEANKLPPAR